MILFHKRGFPHGARPENEERVSLENAAYTQGCFKVRAAS